jgi:hypothetical protein
LGEQLHFLNLTLAELLAVGIAGTILMVVLYLEDRFQRKKDVSSLQFWALLPYREGQTHGKRIRHVSSLLLQLTCFLALLFAVARPEWGSEAVIGKSHLLLLDTSAWTLQDNGHGSILDREKTLAREYISTLPASDRVMLTRVDGLVVPLTPFTTDRLLVQRRLSETVPSLLALNLREALSFARQTSVLSLSGEVEVVYMGPARIAEGTAAEPGLQKLRVVLVEAKPSHCGISHVGLARDDQVRSSWRMTVALRNYGTDACHPILQITLSGAALPVKRAHLAPGENTLAEYTFTSTQSEPLAITLAPEDGLSSDHRVALQLPALAPTRIAVYTSRPKIIQDLVETVPNATISLRKESDYRSDPVDADLIILDRVSPAIPSQVPTLWINPDGARSPFPVKTSVTSPKRVLWNSHTSVAQGLHSEDLPLPPANIYQLREGDTPVLSVPDGPVVVVRASRDGHPRRAILGFDPANDSVRYEITTPLLFINIVRWLAAQTLAPTQIAIGHAGAGAVDLGEGESIDDVQVIADTVRAPLIVQNRQVQFFAAQPAVVRFSDQGRNEELHMSLPEIAETVWRPPTPQTGEFSSTGSHRRADLWRWLVLAGITITSLEWWLFGGGRHLPRAVVSGGERGF